ncbi:hypothetical protein PAXRUDRAFT_113897, partial [Paxillus rubicundulus Ve08.2h10]
YITHLLEEYGLLNCNPVGLPMVPVCQFGRDTDVHPDVPSLSSTFPKLNNESLYLALLTQPDIVHSILTLAQFSSKLELHLDTAVKHVLCYL